MITGEILLDLAFDSALIQPEFSSLAGTGATICSGVEVAARVGKAAITGKQEDIDKAKKSVIKNGSSYLAGKAASVSTKKLPEGISNLISGYASKKAEQQIESSTKTKEENK